MEKSRGLIRRVEDAGRVCLPIEYRKVLDLLFEKQLEIISDGDKIVIRKPIVLNGTIQLKGTLRTFENRVGRIVIPREIRKNLKIKKGTRVEIYPINNTIEIKVIDDRCVFCGITENLNECNQEFICDNCIEKLSRKVS